MRTLAVPAESRKWWVLVAMTGSFAMIALDSTILGVALPTIQRDLDMSTTGLQWTVNSYLLALAVCVALAGRLADMFNQVRTFIVGVVIFTVMSGVAGAA